jgi:uncharacterized protein YukE
METEQVRAVARQLQQTSNDIHQAIYYNVGNKLRGLNWQSPRRERFINKFEQLEREMRAYAEESTTLGLRVQREVDEWEQAAATLVAVALSAEQIRAIAISDTRQSLQKYWNGMSLKERKKWLEEWYRNLCMKLGIPPTSFKVKDLYDPEGKDARGVYAIGLWLGLFSSMTIDIDNVKGNDPFEVLETIGHETRHQYQHFLVEHPDERPDDISKEMIHSWKQNFDNYRRPEDDFEAYRDQPVERDAREAGQMDVRKYVERRAEVI